MASRGCGRTSWPGVLECGPDHRRRRSRELRIHRAGQPDPVPFGGGVDTARSQFGNAEAAVRINKPLIVEPALPRFANVGDRLLARAVVLNRTDAAGEVEVSLTLDAQAKLDANGAPAAALVGRWRCRRRGRAGSMCRLSALLPVRRSGFGGRGSSAVPRRPTPTRPRSLTRSSP